jgi:hypothetical protein
VFALHGLALLDVFGREHLGFEAGKATPGGWGEGGGIGWANYVGAKNQDYVGGRLPVGGRWGKESRSRWGKVGERIKIMLGEEYHLYPEIMICGFEQTK